MKNVSIGIGIFLGMLAVPIAIYFINNVVYEGNNAEKAAPIYIKNSEDLKVFIPDAEPSDTSGLFNVKFKRYKRNIRSDKNGDVLQVLFYIKEHNKFFSILLYDGGRDNDYLLGLNISNQQTVIAVNIDDFNSLLYGTKSNPVPVFKFNVLSPKSDYPCLHTTQEQYLYNVNQYLQFVMPKEEFQKRFGK